MKLSGLLEYACDAEGCVRAFGSARALALHKAEAHGPSSYRWCRHCGKGFPTTNGLNIHSRQRHGDSAQGLLEEDARRLAERQAERRRLEQAAVDAKARGAMKESQSIPCPRPGCTRPAGHPGWHTADPRNRRGPKERDSEPTEATRQAPAKDGLTKLPVNVAVSVSIPLSALVGQMIQAFGVRLVILRVDDGRITAELDREAY